jgi:hypothetical protein
MNIQEFAQAHQKHYGQNIEFNLVSSVDCQIAGEPAWTNENAHLVTYEVKTSFGNFQGRSAGKKWARAAAVEAAASSKACPF